MTDDSCPGQSVGLGGESTSSPLTFHLSTAIETSLAQHIKAALSPLSSASKQQQMSFPGKAVELEAGLALMALTHHACVFAIS